MHKKIATIITVTMVANSAIGDARFIAQDSILPSLTGLTLTQNYLEAISDSNLRRLSFYSERAMGALIIVVDAAEANDFAAQTTANQNLRTALKRLADGGTRSGLSTDNIAEYFANSVSESLGEGFMQKVSNILGGLELSALIRNVSATEIAQNTTLSNSADFLDALDEASEGLSLSEAESEVQIIDPLPGGGPIASSNATSAELSIVERVVVNNGNWQITVQRGDTLALIASAIYRDALSYNVIFQANQNTLANPNSLNVGDRLILPKP